MTDYAPPGFEQKIISPEQLAAALAQLPRPLVFTIAGTLPILPKPVRWARAWCWR